MSRPSGSAILAPLDVERLQNQGLLSPRSDRGTRKIHKRLLTPSSDEEHRDIPLDVPIESAAADDAFVTIPDKLISRATLVYVGFSERKAAQLWASWIKWLFDGFRPNIVHDIGGLQMAFCDFVTNKPFRTNVDADEEDNDQKWTDALNAYGMAAEFQRALLDPTFKSIRLTQSCCEWAKDTVEMRYTELENVQRASQERERALQRAASRLG